MSVPVPSERVAPAAMLAALTAHHAESGHHSRRVARIALCLAEVLNLAPSRRRALYVGALMHDAGKLAVAQSILDKPCGERLTDREWERLREHPWAGAELLVGLGFSLTELRVVLEHHERWDGTGYPRGLAGTEISLEARITAVADAYDAITADRCYRRGLPDAVARHEIVAGGGTQFDPYVVEALSRVPADELRAAGTPHPTARPVQYNQ